MDVLESFRFYPSEAFALITELQLTASVIEENEANNEQNSSQQYDSRERLEGVDGARTGLFKAQMTRILVDSGSEPEAPKSTQIPPEHPAHSNQIHPSIKDAYFISPSANAEIIDKTSDDLIEYDQNISIRYLRPPTPPPPPPIIIKEIRLPPLPEPEPLRILLPPPLVLRQQPPPQNSPILFAKYVQEHPQQRPMPPPALNVFQRKLESAKERLYERSKRKLKEKVYGTATNSNCSTTTYYGGDDDDHRQGEQYDFSRKNRHNDHRQIDEQNRRRHRPRIDDGARVVYIETITYESDDPDFC